MSEDEKFYLLLFLAVVSILAAIFALRVSVAVLGIIGGYIVMFTDQFSYFFSYWDINSPYFGWLALGYSVGIVMGLMRGLWATKQKKMLDSIVILLVCAALLYPVAPIATKLLILSPYLMTVLVLNFLSIIGFLIVSFFERLILNLIVFFGKTILFIVDLIKYVFFWLNNTPAWVPSSFSGWKAENIEPILAWLLFGLFVGSIWGLIRGLRYVKKI
jgi:hypothetical protein